MEKLFSAVKIKNCGCCNDRKHRDIKGSDKYVTLDISLKIDNLENMKITSSESKEKQERSEKGLIISLGIRARKGHIDTKSQSMPLEMSLRRTF